MDLVRGAITLYAAARGLAAPSACQSALAKVRRMLAGNDGRKIDFATRPVRQIGELYESLLAADRGQRKARGSFYTPQPIVDYLIQQCVGERFRSSLRVSKGNEGIRPWQLKILDPAMGTGHFLITAMRYLAERLIALDEEQLADAPPILRSQGDPQERLQRAMHYVATHCLWGIDLDPQAVAISRACLWLEIGLPDVAPDFLEQRLLTGDTLTEDSLLAGEQFDCILGNPPYGSRIDPALRKRLVQRLPQMKHNGDTAVGFLERSSQLLNEQGRCGLIVPKPLTYSFAWRHMRTFLDRRVEHIVDVSRAFPDVKLEQVILVFGPRSTTTTYDTAWLNGQGFAPPRRLSWRWAERFGTLPCALDADDLHRLERLSFSRLTLGDIARTFRGLPLQRQLGPTGEIAVLGGRDLARWQKRSVSGFVSRAELADSLAVFQQPKLLFQNIIAHVTRPQPHILLIGAYDDADAVTLDTVNNLVARVVGVPLHGLLALLHSRLVNWFVYSVIYNKAIRTMHFDQYFLNKIPLPAGHAMLLERLAELSREAEHVEQPHRGKIVAEIDRLVDDAYGEDHA